MKYRSKKNMFVWYLYILGGALHLDAHLELKIFWFKYTYDEEKKNISRYYLSILFHDSTYKQWTGQS